MGGLEDSGRLGGPPSIAERSPIANAPSSPYSKVVGWLSKAKSLSALRRLFSDRWVWVEVSLRVCLCILVGGRLLIPRGDGWVLGGPR